MYPGITRSRSPTGMATPSDRNQSTPMKLASSTEDCTRPMPRSVVISVRFCASAWMRWSGLTPISPARLMRAARLRVIQFPIRSLVASSRSFTRNSWLKPVCATLSTSRMAAITKKTPSWRTNSGRSRRSIAS